MKPVSGCMDWFNMGPFDQFGQSLGSIFVPLQAVYESHAERGEKGFMVNKLKKKMHV